MKITSVAKFEESLGTIVENRGSKLATKGFGKLQPSGGGSGAIRPTEPVKKLTLKMEGSRENTLSIWDPIEGEELFGFVNPSKDIIAFNESGKVEALLPRRPWIWRARIRRWRDLSQLSRNRWIRRKWVRETFTLTAKSEFMGELAAKLLEIRRKARIELGWELSIKSEVHRLTDDRRKINLKSSKAGIHGGTSVRFEMGHT